jgi:hypothetical protein
VRVVFVESDLGEVESFTDRVVDGTMSGSWNDGASKKVVDLVHGCDDVSNGALLIWGEEKSDMLEHLVTNE